jgi:predicted peptidase
MTTIDELYAQVNALPPDQRATLIARLLHDARQIMQVTINYPGDKTLCA